MWTISQNNLSDKCYLMHALEHAASI